MKKSQFYLLFSIFLAFYIIYLLANNYSSIDDSEKSQKLIYYLNNEFSYLVYWNCSYNITTLRYFSYFIGIPINFYYYWDTCINKTIKFSNYRFNLTVTEEKNNYKACFGNICKVFFKEGRHFCLVYSINNKIVFECW